MNKDITLQEITMDNFHECIKLTVNDEQKGFVADNSYSLAEAKADDVSNPYAIYNDDTMVGFIMYWYDYAQKRGYIDRLMIDKKYQANGFGKKAMLKIIEILGRIDGIKDIQTSYNKKNNVAGKLYKSLGFEPTGEIVEDREIVVIKTIYKDKIADVDFQSTSKDILNTLISRIKSVKNVESIGISGKFEEFPLPGKGDIDIFIYCSELPSDNKRADAISNCSGLMLKKLRMGNGSIWGLMDYGTINGVDVFMMYYKVSNVIKNIEEILQGKYLWKINNDYYPIGRLSTLINMSIMYDENDFLTSIKYNLKTYPKDLKMKVIDYHKNKMINSEDFERAVSRDDVLFYHATLDTALEHFLFVIFALNDTYFPSRKRSFEYIEKFKVKPKNCCKQIEKIIINGASSLITYSSFIRVIKSSHNSLYIA